MALQCNVSRQIIKANLSLSSLLALLEFSEYDLSMMYSTCAIYKYKDWHWFWFNWNRYGEQWTLKYGLDKILTLVKWLQILFNVQNQVAWKQWVQRWCWWQRSTEPSSGHPGKRGQDLFIMVIVVTMYNVQFAHKRSNKH